jgi:hypothetical protein
MLSYSKIILDKVSFDIRLFKKELRKLKRWVKSKERKELSRWCKEKYPSFFIKNV